MKYFLELSMWTFTLLFAQPLFGQEPLSLSQAIQTGLTNNYGIQIAGQEVEMAQNINDWAVAGAFPTVSLTLNSNNSYTNLNNPASFLIESSSVSGSVIPAIEASWVLFDGYRVRFTKQRLEELERFSQGNLQIQVENSIQATIDAYYAALVQKEGLDVMTEVLKLSRDRLAYQEIRREFGQAGTFDVLQTQDAYLNDSISFKNQQVAYENALRNLNLAMGVDDLDTRYTLTDQLEFEAAEYQLDDLKTKMTTGNKNLQNLLINRQLARINTSIQESAKYPSVSLRTGLTYNVNISAGTQTFLTGDPRDIPQVAAKTFNGFLNLTATYNLFDGGVRKKNIENAKKEELIAQLDIETVKRDLNAQLENTLATYNNDKQLVTLTSQLVENARRNLEIAEERFQGGLINSFDYRIIQLGYINATQSRLTAIFNLKSTETELIRLIGGLVR
jgi:outer membrane protein